MSEPWEKKSLAESGVRSFLHLHLQVHIEGYHLYGVGLMGFKVTLDDILIYEFDNIFVLERV